MKKMSSYLIVMTIVFILSINVLAYEKEFTSLTQYVPKTEELQEQIKSSIVVFENYTRSELITQINKSLNSAVSNKGELIVDTCLAKNVNPFLATAILLQETGCAWNCSGLVTRCNNVGGQKGPGCDGWKYYSTLDDGIEGFINNISVNFVSKGKTTAETMTGYAANTQEWSRKVNKYIEKIKAA